jgi:type IV pilus assembly protein PilC
MKKYSYRAKDLSGKTITGLVEASDKTKAAKLLKQKGYIVISISSASGIADLLTSMRSRVSQSDVAAFTRQLATMINAGLPITESLSILRMQAKETMQATVTAVLADVEGGSSLSKALEKHPQVFSRTYVALIRSGEAGGVLDKVLNRLADTMERQQEFNSKVKGALIYPAIVVLGMGIVSLIMILFVIPRMTDLYDQFGAELPLPTRILLGISSFILTFWPIIVVAIIIGIFAFNRWKKTPAGQRKLDEIILKIPIVGDLQKQVVLTELTRTLALTVGAGVPILEGITVSADVVKNSVIADALRDVGHQVEKGFPIAFALAKHPESFPYILSQMVSVGEETGKMEEVLDKVAHVFETESEGKVKALTTAIEPIIMIFLGVGVAFLVISVILPIYNLTTTL